MKRVCSLQLVIFLYSIFKTAPFKSTQINLHVTVISSNSSRRWPTYV